MKIGTMQFQDIVGRAFKGASCSRILPITSMMEIQLKDNVLSLTTTDTANTLTVIADKVDGEDFYAVVPAEIFSKLIAKTTSESITLELKESSLDVKGNGNYSIPLPMDEDGLIEFPKYEFTAKGRGETLNLTTVKNILAINKAAASKTIENPCMCGYYLGDAVVTSDQEVICFNQMRVLKGDYLVSPEMMELLQLAKEEKISVSYADGYFLCKTPDMILHGPEHDGKELYPIADIMGYLDVEFKSSCKVPSILLQSVIDRLSLFIEPYDKNGAYFTFTEDGIKITSKKSSSIETVAYLESNNFQPFVCCVDIPMLKAQIDANPEDVIEIFYGNESALKMASDKIVQVLALMEDENMGVENGK